MFRWADSAKLSKLQRQLFSVSGGLHPEFAEQTKNDIDPVASDDSSYMTVSFFAETTKG